MVPMKCTLHEESAGSEEGGAKPSKTDMVAATSNEDIEFSCDNKKSSTIMSFKVLEEITNKAQTTHNF